MKNETWVNDFGYDDVFDDYHKLKEFLDKCDENDIVPSIHCIIQGFSGPVDGIRQFIKDEHNEDLTDNEILEGQNIIN